MSRKRQSTTSHKSAHSSDRSNGFGNVSARSDGDLPPVLSPSSTSESMGLSDVVGLGMGGGVLTIEAEIHKLEEDAGET